MPNERVEHVWKRRIIGLYIGKIRNFGKIGKLLMYLFKKMAIFKI